MYKRQDVISLGIGSPDMPPSRETIETLCNNAHDPNGHGYQPYVGIPELRKGFANWYQRWYGVELKMCIRDSTGAHAYRRR